MCPSSLPRYLAPASAAHPAQHIYLLWNLETSESQILDCDIAVMAVNLDAGDLSTHAFYVLCKPDAGASTQVPVPGTLLMPLTLVSCEMNFPCAGEGAIGGRPRLVLFV